MPSEAGPVEAPREPAPAVASRRTDRWRRLRSAADGLPPPAREMAWGTLAGALLLAAVNAVAIAVGVDMPLEGLGLRLAHHGYAAALTMGAAAWLALPLALAPRLGAPRWLGWLLLGAAAVAAMGALLSVQLYRQAHAAFNGAGAALLYPFYIVLSGCAIPAAYLLGGFFGRLGGYAAIGAALGLGGMIVGHAILRDDYLEVHAAILWVAAVLAGGSVAPALVRWVEASRRRRLGTAGAVALAGLFAVVFPPPNRVRQELFRDPGAAAAWALARTRWRPPAVAAAAEAPAIEPYPDEVMARASERLPADPVVVLLTVDALRGDVVSDERVRRFRWLSWLRGRGAYFSQAVAAGSQTSVSLTSMFASRYFSQLYWEPFGEGRSRFHYAASDDSPRFPALLTAAGVKTTSSLGVVFLQDRFGIARGFEHEIRAVEGRAHGHAPTVLRPLLDALEAHQEGPAFFYAHLMEPHEPYDRGGLEGDAFERYLREIEVADRWIGRVLSVLRRRFRGRSYLIVTADHGEAFGEHGTFFHTKTLYDELLHVPLLIWGAAIPARRHAVRASVIDVGPTVLSLFRQPTPPTMMGRSLLPLMRGLVDEVPRPVFAEGRLRRAYYRPGGLKVIEDDMRKVVEVYDLEADPDEMHNLFGSDEADRAVAELRAFFARHALVRPGYRPPYKP